MKLLPALLAGMLPDSSSGAFAFVLSNHSYGTLQTDPIAVLPGATYTLSAWVRGELNAQASGGGWTLKLLAYDRQGALISSYTVASGGGGSLTTTWQQRSGTVTLPDNATTVRVELFDYMTDGWVAMDDVSLTGATVTKYYYLGSQRVAMRQGGVLTYLHGDHLGSASLATDVSGTKVSEQRYLPYGGTRSGEMPTDRQFTGQRRDYYIKLYYMGARMYDPELGRFISPDSIVPDFSNPQSLNRYSYVYNSPLKYIDSSGHIPIPVIIAVGVAIFKAVDYGWTAYDAWQSSLILSSPDASDVEKAAAAANLAMTAAFEAAEPDDFLPIGLPLDDLARHGVLKYGDEVIQYGDEVVAGGTETYRAVSDNWPFNWKPTRGDIAGNPAGLSCSVGCEGMNYQEIFEMSVGRSAEPGDHLYAVNTEVLRNSKFGLTPDPLPSSNPYHAVTGGSQVWNWTKPIAREFKDMWQLIWSFAE